MKKTLKKVLALLLALTVIFSIPVIACAADDGGKFDFTDFDLKVTDGDWLKNKVNKVRITVSGPADRIAASGVILTMGTNAAADNMFTFKRADLIKCTCKNGVTTLEFKVDKKLDHAKDYTFRIVEGAFASNDGTVNSEYKETMSGNLIIETIDADLSENPIGRLVKDMENSDYAWLWFPVIVILKWFMSL